MDYIISCGTSSIYLFFPTTSIVSSNISACSCFTCCHIFANKPVVKCFSINALSHQKLDQFLHGTLGVYFAMSLFFSYILSLTLKPFVLVDLVQVLSSGRRSSSKNSSQEV
jgi:hypothetical protein